MTKTLQYGIYPESDCTSLPVTGEFIFVSKCKVNFEIAELAAEIFSRAKNKLSLDFLDVEEAARLSRSAAVSPCSLVLALLYLDRLKASNPKYLAKVPSSQLFLISLVRAICTVSCIFEKRISDGWIQVYAGRWPRR